ncbi:hypothetical protein [Streptomyces botrytidirepellens]|uniref:Uncharacterized protein n=1 Tax=Streptomyces botrytidirepellens TaxID=2486417 RepID=A0A3M8VM21_9ACTN|nr:hypothetical protein [Streptomyces botrytidirepellens]RNG17849.1 hypothetical protein EEJ42_29100 [Streptomyces botrytidirepellens]
MHTPSRTERRDPRSTVPHPATPPRIGAGEAVVIIVILILAAALTVQGTPPGQVLQVLAEAGALSVIVLRAWSLAPLRMARSALSAVSPA